MAFCRLWCLVGLAAILAAMMTGALAQGQPYTPSPSRGPGGQPHPPFDREAMFKYLNITAQQRTRLIQLMNDTEEKMRQIFTKLHEQRTQLMQLYQQYQFDEKAALRLIQNINQTQAELLKLHHENHKQLRRILDKEQFERWNQWWKERMFAPPPKGEWGRRWRDGKPG